MQDNNDFWQDASGQENLPQKQNVAQYHKQHEEYGFTGQASMHEQIQSDLKCLLNQPEGRRVLRLIFAETLVFEPLPVGSLDIYAYYEGKRSLGLMLYHRVQALGINYLNMLQGE